MSQMSQTPMEKALGTIVKTFNDYAMETEPFNTLSKAEFAQLMKEQLPNFIQGAKEPEALDNLFRAADQNKDVLLTLDEFLDVVARILVRRCENLHRDH